MALSDKNIVITPNIGAAADPKIVFSGADASTSPQNVTMQVYPASNGTLSIDGSVGQLFSVTSSMTGTIFSVNDISGIPSIEVLDTGLVKLAQYNGNVTLGSTTSTTTVNGSLRVTGTGFQLGPDTTLGTVKWDKTTTPTNPWFGIYDNGGGKYYGIATNLPAPSGVAALGGYYQGMGIGGNSNNTNLPIFGVLNNAQSGGGLGSTTFTVYDNKKIVTFTNTLDDGSGNMIVAATTASTSTTTGALKVSGGVGVAGALYTGSDANVNGLTIGRGDGNIASNTAVGFDALGSPNIQTNNTNNVGIGYNALNQISVGVTTVTLTNGGSGYNDDGGVNFSYDVRAAYSSGATATVYPYLTVTVTNGIVTNVVIATNYSDPYGYGFTLGAATVMTIPDYAGYGYMTPAIINIGTYTSASSNTAIGSSAGSTIRVASNNVYIGAGTTGIGLINEIVIGAGAAGGGSNTVVIGDTNITSTTIRNINTTGTVNLPASGGNVSLGTSVTNGTINIGGTSLTSTGLITLGRSVGNQTVGIATGNNGNQVTKAVNIGTGTTSTTSITNITIGASLGTGTISIGNSVHTQLIAIGTGNNTTTETKTINIGTNGTTGTTSINIGSNSGTNSTTTLNGAVTILPYLAGVISIGNTAGTGTITLGQSTAAQTTNIQAGATASGSTKTLNIGTGGLAGSTTNIAIGSTAGTSTTTINGAVTLSATTQAINLGNSQTSGVINIGTADNRTGAINIGTGAGSLTTGAITIGDSTGQQTITLGRSTGNSIVNIATGAATGGVDKTVNIGTNSAGANTYINLGSGSLGSQLYFSGQSYFSFRADFVDSIGQTSVTVSSLPAAVDSVLGDRHYVTNANNPRAGSVVVGGGSTQTPVFFDGTNWICDSGLGQTTGTGSVVLSDSPTLTNPTFTGYTETVYAVVDAAGVPLSPNNGTIQTWTLGANRTPTAGTWVAGQSMTLMISDNTAYTVTWTSMGIVWVGGSAPTLATTGFTVIELWKVGTTIYGALVGNVA